MGHAPQETGGVISDQLTPGDGPPYVPELFVMGRASQHIPLPIPGFPPYISGDGALSLPGKAEAFSPVAVKCPRRGKPPVFGVPWRYPQATTDGESPRYLRRPGILVTPRSRHAGAGKEGSGVCRSRRAFRRISASGHPRRALQLSPSLHPTHLLSKRCGSICRDGTITQLTPPPPPLQSDH